MHTYTKRGRGDNRPLGFYGVGALAATQVCTSMNADGSCAEYGAGTDDQTGSGEGGAEGTGIPGTKNNSSGESSGTTASTFVQNPDGTFFDTLTGLILNPKTGAIVGGTPKPKTTETNYTNLVLIAAGVVGLLFVMKK